jgi:hypothetical protein
MVRLQSGETYSELCQEPKGGPKVPFAAEEMDAKYRNCARRAIGERETEASLGMLRRLDELSDVRGLCDLLRGATVG